MDSLQKQQSIVACYAFAGGFADASTFVVYKTFTGHITGNLILFTIAIVSKDWKAALLRAFAAACFLLCTRLGMAFAARKGSMQLLFILQAALMTFAAFGGEAAATRGMLSMAAFCCSLGLQNGVISSAASKVSLHTTFISGDLTSLLKPSAGEKARDEAASWKRPILGALVVAFITGAGVGAWIAFHSAALPPFLFLIPLLAATLLQRIFTNEGGRGISRLRQTASF